MLLAGVGVAGAADFPAPYVEAPVYEAPVSQPVAAAGGWYLRGDAGYSWNKMKGADFWQGVTGTAGWAPFTSGTLRGSYTIGAGVGYQATRYLRGDLTVDYFSKANFRGSTSGVQGGANFTSTDSSSVSGFGLLANAYVDFYKTGRYTFYAGGGLGGTRVKWDHLSNTSCPDAGGACNQTVFHDGRSSWRFTYALMAGASVDVTCNLKADVGYRYRRVSGGEMFGFPRAPAAGARAGTQVYDRGFNSHEVRGGLRYGFGGCAEQEVYIEPAPIMPAVYK